MKASEAREIAKKRNMVSIPIEPDYYEIMEQIKAAADEGKFGLQSNKPTIFTEFILRQLGYTIQENNEAGKVSIIWKK